MRNALDEEKVCRRFTAGDVCRYRLYLWHLSYCIELRGVDLAVDELYVKSTLRSTPTTVQPRQPSVPVRVLYSVEESNWI